MSFNVVGVLRTVRRLPVASVMAGFERQSSTFTDSPGWINKMKDRFAALDENKDGIIDQRDVMSLASRLTKYSKQGEEATRKYFATFNAVYGLHENPTNEEEFLTLMKAFASKLNAEELAHGIGDIVFYTLDEDRNGEVSYDEFYRCYKSVSNMSEEMIQYLFIKSDLNGDGAISRSEFRESFVKLFLSDEDL